MDLLKPFLSFINKFVELSEAEFRNSIEPYLEIRRFRKRDIILNEGEIDQHQNFVLSGLVRKYYHTEEEDAITQIATEGHIINVQESYYTQTPSQFYLQALEPTVLVSMHRKHIEKLYDGDIKMERLGRLVVTNIMVLKDRWNMNLTRMSPRDRFLDFVEKNPGLLQRVPQKYLASYLNIQPETFSRFKHLLKDKPIAINQR